MVEVASLSMTRARIVSIQGMYGCCLGYLFESDAHDVRDSEVVYQLSYIFLFYSVVARNIRTSVLQGHQLWTGYCLLPDYQVSCH